jgi:hypothetical protein
MASPPIPAVGLLYVGTMARADRPVLRWAENSNAYSPALFVSKLD